MNLLKRIFEKSEASSTPLPPQPSLNTLELAEMECIRVAAERQELNSEYSLMASKYNLIKDGLGTPHPMTGTPETTLSVALWWKDFVTRLDDVIRRHNESMQRIASIKYHTGGN